MEAGDLQKKALSLFQWVSETECVRACMKAGDLQKKALSLFQWLVVTVPHAAGERGEGEQLPDLRGSALFSSQGMFVASRACFAASRAYFVASRACLAASRSFFAGSRPCLQQGLLRGRQNWILRELGSCMKASNFMLGKHRSMGIKALITANEHSGSEQADHSKYALFIYVSLLVDSKKALITANKHSGSEQADHSKYALFIYVSLLLDSKHCGQ
eukprot:1161388-Pelagomonas_calceolata.AAC.2